LNGLALCAGVGGLERGIESIIPSSRTVCFVEGETYPASVLASKMEAGLLSKAPIWSNVRTFNGKPWRGKVSFVSGGFPCQPYSQAGKQLADKDPRDLWPDFARIIGEIRPQFIFLENVPNVVKWALPTILKDLSKMGYDAAWCVVAASQVGAPHKRSRWFLFAHSNDSSKHVMRFHEPQSSAQEFEKNDFPNTNGKRSQRLRNKSQEGKILKRHTHQKSFKFAEFESWWKVEPTMGRMVDGVADWVHRMRACGNGVVPQQAAYAYSILMERCGFMVSKP